ncbi:MAG: BREX-4 system phosphatase PglZ [Candidatus Cloacimonetes bacterium]|jgi:hypothetical protein|nr:BREX-4 system phosphatase PglZ [Candidatus Cloacimonadota bacterium]
MKSFTGYQDLLAEIRKDHSEKGGRTGRYAVRLIFLDDFEVYRTLIKDLGVKIVELSELMEHDNFWFGQSRLCDIVSEQKEDSVIVPISEVIRFYDDANFESFLGTVLLIQNQEGRRIYIPLVGVKERFQKFWNSFNRKTEGPPVWYLTSDAGKLNKITVYSCMSDVNTLATTINTNKEWLEYWKTDRSTPLITKTQSLIRRWEEFLPNGCFDKDSISSSKDVLLKVLNLNFSRSYLASEEIYWKALLAECERDTRLQSKFPVQILEELLGIQDFAKIDDIDIMVLFLNSEWYARWLITLVLDQVGDYDTYLKNVISNLPGLSEHDLIYGLYFDIFKPKLQVFVSQRRKLIEALPKQFQNLVSKFKDSWFERLKESGMGKQLCTCYSIEERDCLVNDLADTEEFSELWEVYPKLAAYLDWEARAGLLGKIMPQFIEYFKEYSRCKSLNKVSLEFDDLFEKLNGSKDSFYKWYYAVTKLKVEPGYKIIQFDGVGAEWLPYILYCVEQHGAQYAKEVESCELRRVALPSITSLNKIEEAEFVRDFDQKIIHKASGYHYPHSLIESLDLIEEMIVNHVLLSPEGKICICADHGASFMCRRTYGAMNMHTDLEAKHEGRYYEGAKDIPDNEAFFNVGKYFVALKHHVISTNVRREVHGGATPEEVLVPCVFVSRTALGYMREYVITLSGHTLTFDSRILQISINPKPDLTPEFWCNDKAIESKRDTNKFLLDLSSFDPGKYRIRVQINKKTFIENIEISAGFVEEDLFDE